MADTPVDGRSRSNSWLLFGSLIIAATFVLFLCLFFALRWEVNDDIGMSMIAHGYGEAGIGSPNLVLSNVLWGCVVRAIPKVNGALGYSVATLLVLITVGTAVVYGLYRLGAGHVASLSALALILARPVLFPQFTINAGLLAVVAVICWHLYERQKDRRELAAGCLFAFLSYLVRSREFWLVLIVALPLLPWRTLFSNRSAKAAILILVSAIALSAAIDHQAYQRYEWKAFNELKPLALEETFSAFRSMDLLKQHPDILNRHGFSANDIDLVKDWFFVDPRIANPDALKAMLHELGPLPEQNNALTKGWIGVKTLFHPHLLPLAVIALLLAVLRPSRRLITSWGIFISAVFFIGVLFRPGVLRIYVPLICLLLVASFFRAQVPAWRIRIGACVLLIAAVLNSSLVFSESKAFQIADDQTRKDFINFPSDLVVNWGAAFPYEAVYPVLGASSSAMSIRLYSLGWGTLAPFSAALPEQNWGCGMIDRLKKKHGIPIIASEQEFGYLDIYCREHLHGRLKELSVQRYGALKVSRRRCELGP
jgi:hypothetical protein